MSETSFYIRKDSYRRLIGSDLTYRVPRFQRDYSWGEDEWDNLWHDILDSTASAGEPAHYMGHVVLHSTNGCEFDILDGQQRLTTLSILVLAALSHLKRLIKEGADAEQTQKRIEGLRRTYIGYLDSVTLVSKSKLTLNRITTAIFKPT